MRIVMDMETCSTADLRKTGAQAYAENPDTRVTVLAYCFNDSGVFYRSFHELHQVSDEFCDAIENGATVVAHNYLFEWNVYHQKLVPLGWPPIPLSQWSCTMARSLVAGYPASLEMVSRAAKLAIPKDSGARDLMLRMARPRAQDPIVWWHETSPEHFKRLVDYCRQDVEAERLLDKAVPELSARERAIFDADFHINQRGIHVDLPLVDQLRDLAVTAKAELTQKLIRLTNGQVRSPNQVAQLKDWLAGVGVELPDIRRATVAKRLLDPALQGPARGALQCRLDASRSSVAKLDAIGAAVSQDGGVKGCFQYYGAGRTGRQAGRRLQPQNLFRGSIKHVADAITAIQGGATTGELEMLFEDSAMGVVASCLRSTIIARPGHRLVVMDFSQIEARVLAWLANEPVALECFRRGDDIYVVTAQSVGSGNRQLGKVLVLACGYGMGAFRFQQTAAAFGIDLPLMECDRLVTMWREANANIVQFWWDGERAMKNITTGQRKMQRIGQHTVAIRRPNAALIRLPVDRHLVYRKPHIVWNPENKREQFCYMGSLGGNWMQLRAWPGKIAENITQAVARDVMADAMVRVSRTIPLIATVHDELIAEVPEEDAEQVYSQMKLIMSETPAWAPGLPMNAEGFIARRYQKK